MKRMYVVAVLFVSLFSFSLFADAKADIKAMGQSFAAAARAGNLDRMMDLYADDAVLMAPNLPPLKGSGAIRGFWNGLLNGGSADVDIIPDEVMVSGNMAVERGRFEVRKPIQDTGSYVIVLEKRGGKWIAVADIFNSSVALPQQ